MMATTTMWTRFTRRLGCDGNPLRRRADRIEAWLLPVTVAVFLALCPLVAAISTMWVRADNAAVQRAAASWTKVPGVLQATVPGPEQTDHGANTWLTWTPATWTEHGKQVTGDVPAPAGSRAGARVTVLLGQAGRVEAPPLTAAQVRTQADTATVMTLPAVAVLLAIVAGLVRRVLDRRRLALWETGWLTVGPRWTRQP